MRLEDITSEAATYTVVLEPDTNEAEWWAGAPSALVVDDRTFYLAARMREGPYVLI